MDECLQEALRRAPQFKGLDPNEVETQRLGGLTNIVYRVTHDDTPYVVRIPGEGTEEYIDRSVEAHNAKQAAAAGVNAPVLYFDEDDGLMVCRYLEGYRTMSPKRFRRHNDAVERAGEALQRMHTSGRQFRFRFELFAMIDEYLGVLQQLDCTLPDGYHDVVAEAEAVREALAANPQSLAPCHNDPLCENFLDNGNRTCIVDWEYSGMNEPLWDVADLSVEAGLSEDQDLVLLRAYNEGSYTAAELGRMRIYKAMCDLLWTLWGLIQYANGNPADDFWAYATERFARCKALMAQREFGTYLQDVRHNN